MMSMCQSDFVKYYEREQLGIYYIGMSERETFRARLRKDAVSGMTMCQKSVYSMQNPKIL